MIWPACLLGVALVAFGVYQWCRPWKVHAEVIPAPLGDFPKQARYSEYPPRFPRLLGAKPFQVDLVWDQYSYRWRMLPDGREAWYDIAQAIRKADARDAFIKRVMT